DGSVALASAVQSDYRRQRFACDFDGGKRRSRGLAILTGDGGDGVTDLTHDAVVGEQGDGGGDARHRACRAEVQFADAGVGGLRAEDEAFELSVMVDVDRVFRSPR